MWHQGWGQLSFGKYGVDSGAPHCALTLRATALLFVQSTYKPSAAFTEFLLAFGVVVRLENWCFRGDKAPEGSEGD